MVVVHMMHQLVRRIHAMSQFGISSKCTIDSCNGRSSIYRDVRINLEPKQRASYDRIIVLQVRSTCGQLVTIVRMPLSRLKSLIATLEKSTESDLSLTIETK